MNRKRTPACLRPGLLALALVVVVGGRPWAAGETSVAALAGETHFHGIAVDARNAGRVYLATHHGLFIVAPDGGARRISETGDDLMGFTPHPADPDVLYASGHPAGGGNLGFVVSRDGGETWSRLADGVGGPVDFHQMDISKADPQVVYGVYDGLQMSADGGHTWSRVGAAPEGIIDLAASSREVDRIYAATRRGLRVSADGGGDWQPAHESRRPATMVHVTADGVIHAFVAGTGLVRADEPGLEWTVVGEGPAGGVVVHLAAAAEREPRTLYAVTLDPGTRAQGLHVSHDGGRTWARLGAEGGG